jgi:rubrerythrin
MKISDAIPTLKAETIFKRTPTGRSITEQAIETLKATIEDQKNWQSEVVKCINCSIISSSLLASEGCPNCGLKQDFDTNITQNDIL